jgi:hypothetical protein
MDDLLKRIKECFEEKHKKPVPREIVIIHTTAEGLAYWEKVLDDAHQLAKEKKNKKGS